MRGKNICVHGSILFMSSVVFVKKLPLSSLVLLSVSHPPHSPFSVISSPSLTLLSLFLTLPPHPYHLTSPLLSHSSPPSLPSLPFSLSPYLPPSQAMDDQCLSRADLLIEMHLRDLRTQKSLLSKNEMAAQRVSER